MNLNEMQIEYISDLFKIMIRNKKNKKKLLLLSLFKVSHRLEGLETEDKE